MQLAPSPIPSDPCSIGQLLITFLCISFHIYRMIMIIVASPLAWEDSMNESTSYTTVPGTLLVTILLLITIRDIHLPHIGHLCSFHIVCSSLFTWARRVSGPIFRRWCYTLVRVQRTGPWCSMQRRATLSHKTLCQPALPFAQLRRVHRSPGTALYCPFSFFRLV